MSKLCKITGKKPLVGNNVSKSLNRTKRRQFPNLQTKRIFIPELGKKVKIKLTANAIKTIDKFVVMKCDTHEVVIGSTKLFGRNKNQISEDDPLFGPKLMGNDVD